MARATVVPFIQQQILLPEAKQERIITPRVAVVHTHGSKGTPDAIGRYFDREDVATESHLSIGWDTSRQFMPLNRQADAQWDANAFAISIETQDDGKPATPWNEYQMTMIARVLWFLHVEWAIPLGACPNPYGAGAGHHSRFIEWNKSRHGCPAPVREAQFYNVVLPRAQALGFKPLPQPTNRTVIVDATLPVLRVGSRGPAVRKCKALLHILTGVAVDIDDDSFGLRMDTEIANLQRFFGLTPDGVVGQQTWSVLLNLPLA